MRVVTGSRGFIAKHLINRFGREHLILIEREDCYEALEEIDWKTVTHIYHLGGISDTTEDDLNYLHIYNVDFTMKLFECAIKYGIPVVYASSASVYGNSFTYSYNPLNHYAVSKVNVDIWVEANLNKFKNIVGLRFFNVYGNDEKHKKDQASPIYKFERQARLYKKIKVFKNSENYKRDFVWVEDAVDCMIKPMKSGIYDVGTSEPISFRDVADIVAEKYNVPIEEIDFPEHLKNKYQYYTCARKHFDMKFTSVKEYFSNYSSKTSNL